MNKDTIYMQSPLYTKIWQSCGNLRHQNKEMFCNNCAMISVVVEIAEDQMLDECLRAAQEINREHGTAFQTMTKLSEMKADRMVREEQNAGHGSELPSE